MAKIEKTALKRYTGGSPCSGKIGEWITIYMATDSDITYVGDDITVNNPQGRYVEGDVIPSTENVYNVLKNTLTVYKPPEYVAPVVKVTITDGPEPGSYPPGTVVSATVHSECTQNDAGEIILHKLYKNGEEIASSDTSLVLDATVEFTITEDVTFTASYQYADGPLKQDSDGEDYPTGRILAGTVESSVDYSAAFTIKHDIYMGSDLNTDLTQIDTVPTESEILALNTELEVITSGHVEHLPFSEGTNRVIIAVPKSVGTVSKISYAEAGSQDITNLFTCTEVDLHTSTELAPEYTETYLVYHRMWSQAMVVGITLYVTFEEVEAE